MIQKNQVWALQADALLQPVGNGFSRKILAYADQMMCVENYFETGAKAPYHSHPHVQAAYISEGKFLFRVDEEEKVLSKGDSVFLASNVPHGVTCLEKGIVLDIFTPMREDFV
ncbi:MAG: cupin domain-containing protein [Oscillospiraceae bacterium]|nr:cupin domain-containing protein [Oscillospiraceae bacterium]